MGGVAGVGPALTDCGSKALLSLPPLTGGVGVGQRVGRDGCGPFLLQICETVKELVGYELSPLLFRPLFQCLRSSLRHILDANDGAIITPINSRFVDQVGAR